MEVATFVLNPHLEVTVTPRQPDRAVTIKRETNTVSLSWNEWRDFFNHHEEMNVAVHKSWHRTPEGEEPSFSWKGLPSNLLQTTGETLAELFRDSSIDTFAQEQLRSMTRYLLDIKMGALRVGTEKRLRVRFYGGDTQVHLFTYDPVTVQVITLMIFTFEKFMELYKHVTSINQLMPHIGTASPVLKPHFTHHIRP